MNEYIARLFYGKNQYIGRVVKRVMKTLWAKYAGFLYVTHAYTHILKKTGTEPNETGFKNRNLLK